MINFRRIWTQVQINMVLYRAKKNMLKAQEAYRQYLLAHDKVVDSHDQYR